MKERDMLEDDARLICERCIRHTSNFHGQIRGTDNLGFLGVSSSRIEPLKERIIGADDPEIGVTQLFYKLDIDMLSDIGLGTTVNSLTTQVFNGSIPDMTHLRAMTVIRGALFVVLNQHMPEPDVNSSLRDLGVTNAALLRDYKEAIRNNQKFGVRRFKRLIEANELNTITADASIGSIITILKNKTVPAFV